MKNPMVYAKALAASGATALAQFQFEIIEVANAANAILITPPADLMDLFAKVLAVGGIVFAWKNKEKTDV